MEELDDLSNFYKTLLSQLRNVSLYGRNAHYDKGEPKHET